MSMPLPRILLDQRRAPWLWLGFALVLVVGAVDLLTGYELAFSLFYLLPVSIIAWFAGRSLGTLAALISSAVWLLADTAAGHEYSHPAIYLWNSLIRLGFFVVVASLLTTLRSMFEHERELARSDYLTGAVNSRSFDELLTAEIARLARYQHPFTLAYIDLDNFKPVNDRYGHSTGDLALRTVVEHAKRQLRKTDTVARLGGDEFALLLPETDAAAAEAAVSKVQKALLAAMTEHGWPITLSIGVLTCLRPPRTSDDLIRLVDDLMYRAKQGGKNVARFATYAGEPAGTSS